MLTPVTVPGQEAPLESMTTLTQCLLAVDAAYALALIFYVVSIYGHSRREQHRVQMSIHWLVTLEFLAKDIL